MKNSSRFDNLDFDDHESDPNWDGLEPWQRKMLQPTGTPVRDCGYFRALADADFRMGNYESSLRNYSRALEQDNTLYESWFGQVRVLIENGELDEAELWADKALELFPEHPELLAAKAVVSNRMGKRIAALELSDNALSRRGVTSYVWLVRGEILLTTGRPMADHCVNKAIEAAVGPENKGWAHWEVSRLFRHSGRKAQALQHAKEALQALPEESAVWLELGRCQLMLKLADAPQSLKQAVQLNRECSVAARLLRDYRPPSFLSRLFRRS